VKKASLEMPKRFKKRVGLMQIFVDADACPVKHEVYQVTGGPSKLALRDRSFFQAG